MTVFSAFSRRAAIAWGATVLLLLGACGYRDSDLATGDAPNRPIVVGADSSAESRVVAALYRELLTAAGKQVREATTAYATPAEAANAVITKVVGLVPMYETTLLRTFPATDQIPGNTATNLSMGLPVGVVALPPAAAQRGLVVAAGRATASRHGWQSLADLAKPGTALTIGGSALRDPDAPPVADLAKAYGTALTAIEPPDAADLLLLRGDDPAIVRDGLLVLADPGQVLPPEHVFPLMNAEYADTDVRTALARLKTVLTTNELAALAAAVSAGEDPGQAAARWLRAAKLAQ